MKYLFQGINGQKDSKKELKRLQQKWNNISVTLDSSFSSLNYINKDTENKTQLFTKDIAEKQSQDRILTVGREVTHKWSSPSIFCPCKINLIK